MDGWEPANIAYPTLPFEPCRRVGPPYHLFERHLAFNRDFPYSAGHLLLDGFKRTHHPNDPFLGTPSLRQTPMSSHCDPATLGTPITQAVRESGKSALSRNFFHGCWIGAERGGAFPLVLRLAVASKLPSPGLPGLFLYLPCLSQLLPSSSKT